MNFNEKLQNLRKEKGLSQEDLGEKLGVTRQTVSKWELGSTSPKLDDLKKISELFNVSLDELSGIIKEKEISKDVKNNKKHSIIKKIIALILVVIVAIFIGIILYRYFAFKTFYERYEQINSNVNLQYDLYYSKYYPYDNEVTDVFNVVVEEGKVSIYDFLNSTIKIETYDYDDDNNLTVVHETYEYGDNKQYVNETDNKSNVYEYLLWQLRLGEEIGINMFSEKSILSLAMDFNYIIDLNDSEITIRKEENYNKYLVNISRKEDEIYFNKSISEDDNNKAIKAITHYTLTSIDKNRLEYEVLLERVKKQIEE